MPTFRRAFSILALCAAASAGAADKRATDAAFAALLSMPGAKPAAGGEWHFPPAPDFEPTSETALIAYLARMQAKGADFNAYRHHGTVLQHAIRAGAERTAIWLLAHGADPRLQVRGNGNNALELATERKQARLLKVLKDKHGMQGKAPVAPAVQRTPAFPYGENSIITAILQLAGKSAEFEKALAAHSQAEFKGQAQAAFEMMAGTSSARIDRKTGKPDYTVPAASWRIFWRHAGKQFEYAQQRDLAGKVPPELWPELIASGYPNTPVEDALGCLLSDINAVELKAMWPQLTANFPGIRAAAPRMVLAGYRMQGRRGCYAENAENVPPKLAFLTSLGIREPVSGLAQALLERAGPAMNAAVQPFLPPPQAPTRRLVDAAPACSFTLTDSWLTALLRKPEWKPETLQLLEMPGSAQCALLVGGNELEGYETGAADSFTGPEYVHIPSCPDPSDAYEVWQQAGDKIAVLKTDYGHDNSMTGPVLVRDTQTGIRYYLNSANYGGRCRPSGKLPFAFEWRPEGLMQSTSDELENVLLSQCTQADYFIQCPGIAVLTETGKTSEPTAYDGIDTDTFLRQYGAARLKQYLAAVMALDKPALKKIEAVGIPGSWTGDAINAVGASTLPLQEKRKRIAWLFFDHAQLARAAGSKWAGALLDWLPYQDWGPVVAVTVGGHQPSHDGGLRNAAQEKGMARLACDLDNAIGLLCGGSISAER